MSVDARKEAFDRVGGRFDARVLEPSPPAVTRAAVVRRRPGGTGSGRRPGLPLLGPVSSADLTWDDLARDEPDLSEWCAARWLGAYRRLGALPDRAYVWRPATRSTRSPSTSWLRRAGAPPARSACGSPCGGFGTPFFGSDEQARVEGADLWWCAAGAKPARRSRRSTPRAGSSASSPAPGRSLRAGDDGRARRRARRRSGGGAMPRRLVRLLVLGARRDPRRSPGPPTARTQLWPEHFDLSIDVGDEAAGTRGTFGSSPGDAAHPEPYLYATHWSSDVEPDPFWNDTAFAGANLPYAALRRRRPPASDRARLLPPRTRRARCSPWLNRRRRAALRACRSRCSRSPR